MRLNAYIAKCGYASRRKADLLIQRGKVKVNERQVFEPYFRVGPKDTVKIDGKTLKIQKLTYIIFHKPAGVTTTLKDKFASKTITDMVHLNLRLYPVGRLDKNSSGLLILTNDGQLCYKATHPKFGIDKEYLIEVRGAFIPRDCERAKKGVVEGGDFLKVKSIKILKSSDSHSICKVVVAEGKKRHLRRLFASLGFETRKILRIRIGRLKLGNLREGKYRQIEQDKIYSLLK